MNDVTFSASAPAISPVVAIISCVIGLAVCVVYLAAMWKIFAKAGKPGWASIVPIYNLYVLYEISWGKGILFLLNLIFIIAPVLSIITMVKLAKAFGKGTGFALGLIFLPAIFILILGFGSDEYVGVDGAAQPVAYQQPPVQQ